MGRPRSDKLANVRGQLAPPPLDAPLLRLWHREFDQFPPGYYVPADINGMLVYLHTVAEYDAVRARAHRAGSPAVKRVEREEVRAIRRQLIALQRALRMYPITRTHPTTTGRLAHDLARQAVPTTDEPAWRRMMRDVGSLKPN